MKALAKLSPIAAALLAAFGGAMAADDEPNVAQLKTPDSEVSLGAGAVSPDNQRFGQYSGLNDKGAYLLFDADVVRRDDASGTWTRFGARNLGLDSRELRFGQERQGDWGYFIDFSQIPRFDPYTVNTGLQGIGTTTQTQVGVTRGAGTDHQLDTERKRWTVGGSKTLAAGLVAQVVYRDEAKEGARLWGQGTFGNWRFLTDPIDQKTRQIDATLSYTVGKLQLVGGYYGTRFENRNNLVDVSTVAPLGAPPFTQMTLPPDNQSHQFHVSGGYSFTPTTRGMFKVAYGRITQDEAFAPLVGPAGSLDGRIDTTLLQAGLTTRPLPKLSLRADLRYENRDDRTPMRIYFPVQAASPTSTNNGQNEPRDIKTKAAKLDATYQLPLALRLGGGVEVAEKTRNSPPVRSVGFRETTDETTYHVSLRRSIGESATGAVTLLHSERSGSGYLTNVRNDGTTLYSNAIAPLHLADRDRDTVRLVLNWAPLEPLSLNLRGDFSQDTYTGRQATGFELGPRKGEQHLFAVDAAYSFSERLQATAWVSRAINRYQNATCAESGAPLTCTNTSAAPVWGDKLSNLDTSFGLGLRAQASAQLKLGADFVQSDVRDEMHLFSISPAVSSSINAATLPDINTKVRTLKLYGDYAIRRQTGIRVQFVHDRYWTDDWTWANWVYSDGTTVTQNPNQTANFIGAAVYHQF